MKEGGARTAGAHGYGGDNVQTENVHCADGSAGVGSWHACEDGLIKPRGGPDGAPEVRSARATPALSPPPSGAGQVEGTEVEIGEVLFTCRGHHGHPHGLGKPGGGDAATAAHVIKT
jgi:hypothetical protein